MLLNVVQGFGDDRPTGVAGWSDAIVWVPYAMYRATGNELILRENYEAMCRWCEYIIRTAAQKRSTLPIPEEYDKWLWNTGFHFGEWLIPSEPVAGLRCVRTQPITLRRSSGMRPCGKWLRSPRFSIMEKLPSDTEQLRQT